MKNKKLILTKKNNSKKGKQHLLIKKNINFNLYAAEGCDYFVSSESMIVTKKQHESCLRIARFYIKRSKKKIISPIHFSIPLYKKPIHSRMGSGKGELDKYISVLPMNSIIFIFRDVKPMIIYKVYKAINHRLSKNLFWKTY